MSWLRKSSLALLNRVSALTPEATSVAQSPELSTRLGLTALQLEQRRWMAVPKRKTSPSRRGMRNSGKHLKPIWHVAQCSKCERIMDFHQIPHYFCGEADCPSKWSRAPQQAVAAGAAQQ